MNVEPIAQAAIGFVISTTKAQQGEIAKKAADAIASMVASTETKLDDTVVRDLLIPFLTAVVTELEAKFP